MGRKKIEREKNRKFFGEKRRKKEEKNEKRERRKKRKGKTKEKRK